MELNGDRQIVQTSTGGDKPQPQNNETNNQAMMVYTQRRWPFFMTAGAIAGLAAGGGFLIWQLSAAFNDPSTWATFVIGSALNLGVLLAVVAQACIYWGQRNLMAQQWRAMVDSKKQTDTVIEEMRVQSAGLQETLQRERAKTDPRLRVVRIRIDNFDVGRTPIFIITISNDGLINANNVELHIGISMGNNREFNWISPQVVTVPARSHESYPVRIGILPDEQLIHNLTDGITPIEVKVRLKYWPHSPIMPTEFCYRYFPWPRGSERPDDIPQFFGCDFRANTNHIVHVQGIELKLTGHAPEMIHNKSPALDGNHIAPGDTANIVVEEGAPGREDVRVQKSEEADDAAEDTN